ncbi:hypothetical protein C8039_09080 [Halogeometricum sp. wsp3]|nr:hypothetical protein C8039_09080 [Halogeometricum sp. wsp3]
MRCVRERRDDHAVDSGGTVELDLPEQSRVYADWMLDTVLRNVIENAVVHSKRPRHWTQSTNRSNRIVHIGVNRPSVPQHRRDVLSSWRGVRNCATQKESDCG